MRPQQRPGATLLVAVVAVFMVAVDNLVLNTALPKIATGSAATTAQLQWVVSAYTLAFAALQIPAGVLGDRFGRRRWFGVALAVFVLASALGALAPDPAVLIVARAVQGASAAALFPLSLALIAAAYPPERRARALAIWSATSVSGLAVGPLIGGLLVQAGNWQLALWVNVPLGLFALAVLVRAVPESRHAEPTPLRVLDVGLVATGFAAVTWGLIHAGEQGWTHPATIAAVLVGAALVTVFAWRQRGTGDPLVPPALFASRRFTAANVAGVAISFLIAGVAFASTLYLQNVLGLSPVQAGAALLPMVVTMMVGAPAVAALSSRLRPAVLVAGGLAAAAGGLALLLALPARGFPTVLLLALAMIGAGMSLAMTPTMALVVHDVEPGLAGTANAVNGAVREWGTALGVAVLGSVLNTAYLGALPHATDAGAAASTHLARLTAGGAALAGTPAPTADPGAAAVTELSRLAFVDGVRATATVSAVVAIAAAVAVAWLLRRVPVTVAADRAAVAAA